MLMAALLLALGLLGATPHLHAALHHHDEGDHGHASVHDDTGCAVMLYAQGLTPAAPAKVPAPPVATARPVRHPAPAAPQIAAIPHLHPSGRAPPPRQSVTH